MNKQVTTFEPFTDLLHFDPVRGFEELFRDFRHPGLLRPDVPAIRLDVDESEQAYTVSAEIPGVRKEDIKIEIDGSRVAISAERKRETEERQSNALRSERQWGQQYRSFTLQCPIDDGKAEARYENGVLKLVLPKKTQASSQRVEIR